MEGVAREREGEERREEVVEGLGRRGVVRRGPRTPPYPPEEEERVPPSLPQIVEMQVSPNSCV